LWLNGNVLTFIGDKVFDERGRSPSVFSAVRGALEATADPTKAGTLGITGSYAPAVCVGAARAPAPGEAFALGVSTQAGEGLYGTQATTGPDGTYRARGWARSLPLVGAACAHDLSIDVAPGRVVAERTEADQPDPSDLSGGNSSREVYVDLHPKLNIEAVSAPPTSLDAIATELRATACYCTGWMSRPAACGPRPASDAAPGGGSSSGGGEASSAVRTVPVQEEVRSPGSSGVASAGIDPTLVKDAVGAAAATIRAAEAIDKAAREHREHEHHEECKREKGKRCP
jgi:hypothetical protein